MNLDRFKSQVAKNGLAKNTRWECSVFPPSGLSDIGSIFNFSAGPFDILANLPGIDILDNAVEEINNINLDLGNVIIDSNLELPALGYKISNIGSSLQQINFYCNMCSIPERDIQNSEWREFGESRQLAVVHTHGKGLSVSYYCSEDLRERLFFEQWQDLIFDSKSKRRSYYEEYTGSMEVTKYDSSWKNKTAVYRFKEVYPTNIASQTLQFEATSLLRLDINFKYRNYERIK